MTDSEYLQRLVDSSDTATVPKQNPLSGGEVWELDRALELDSHKTLILDGCTLKLRDGAYSNLIISRGAWETDGLRHKLCDIHIIGRNGATLDGGLHNGLTERTQHKDGRPSVLRNTFILLRGVEGFSVSGLRAVSLRYWGMTFYFCSGGELSDIEFEAKNDAPNQDGIDLRLGCHDISISDIRGSTGDDVIALTALFHPVENAFRPENSHDSPDESCDVYNVNISKVSAECTGGHGIIRLLCQDGINLHDVTIDGVYDRALDHDGVSCYAAVRLGDVNYWTLRRAETGEMRDITVRGVETKAKQAVMRNVEIPGLTLENIIKR